MKEAKLDITDATAPVTVLVSPKGGRGWKIHKEFSNLKQAVQHTEQWNVADDSLGEILDADDDNVCLRLLADQLHDKYDVIVTNNPGLWLTA